MSKEKKSYYSILPANVRYCKKLKPNAKLLYSEITALVNEKGYCWANNRYFADLYEVSQVSISKWIGDLERNGFIKCELKNNNKRKIYIERPLKKSLRGYKEKFKGVQRKVLGYNNNTINNKTKLAKKHRHVRSLLSFGDKTFYVKYAKKLSSLINKEGRMSRKVGIERWTKEIRLLRTSQSIEKIRIKNVIEWLRHHLNDEYTPKIYKADDFREKFKRIEDAMSMSNKKSETGETVVICKKIKGKKNSYHTKSVLRSAWKEYKAKGWLKE